MPTHPARRARAFNPPTGAASRPAAAPTPPIHPYRGDAPLPVERSLIQLGPSLAATIPKAWAARLGLAKGAKVHLIFETDGVRVKKP